MKVGLFFGSFNPIHIGHLAIANYILEYSDLEEIWLIVSPQNPHKEKRNLLNEYDRLMMVELALDNHPKLKPSNIEFNLPRPSYTIDTLTYLKERHSTNEFVLIMGTDNLKNFHKWKNSDQILEHYNLYVYPRPGSGLDIYEQNPKVKLIAAPQMDISSSFIRSAIRDQKDVRYFLPEGVYNYINQKHLYEN